MPNQTQLKRICVFVEHFPPYLGSDRTTFEIARQMAKKGIEIHFIATQPLRYLLGHRPKNWKYTKNWEADPPKVHQNITTKYLLLPPPFKGLWNRFMPLAFLITVLLFTLQAVHEVVQHRPNIIVTANASPIVGLVSFIAAKLTRTRNVMGCPDWIAAYAASLTDDFKGFQLALLQTIERFLYRMSTRIVAVTYYLQKMLVNIGVPPEKIAVIPNGVDTDLFTPSVEISSIRTRYRLENTNVVLFSGHLEDWAGLTLLIDLARILDEEVEPCVILLVGAGASLTQLFEKLSEENLGHMITYAGMHPYTEMPRFTAVADVALCVFPDTPVSHAASPLKLFEYMSAGRAIVATRVAGTEEILTEDCGILVSPDNIDEICYAVVQLCRDEKKRNQLGQCARKAAVDSFSWSHLASKFLYECKVAVHDR